MVNETIEQAKRKRESFLKNPDRLRVLPAIPLGQGVPTLKSFEYRPFSPQLKERYELFDRWETATHGHWLGLNDMETLWRPTIENEFLSHVKSQQVASQENWPNEASALFRPDRLSLFACSDLTNEKIYLLWLDFEDEPELWVYDSNGESRYKDLHAYLKAYLADDLSASQRPWRA